jgi:hypothetical protein
MKLRLSTPLTPVREFIENRTKRLFARLRPHQAMNAITTSMVIIETLSGWRRVRLSGRALWALKMLDKAGPTGVDPMEVPAPRWSGYVWQFRQRGIDVGTVPVPHGGEFEGWHGKYVLNSQVLFMGEPL